MTYWHPCHKKKWILTPWSNQFFHLTVLSERYVCVLVKFKHWNILYFGWFITNTNLSKVDKCLQRICFIFFFIYFLLSSWPWEGPMLSIPFTSLISLYCSHSYPFHNFGTISVYTEFLFFISRKFLPVINVSVNNAFT